MSEQASESTPLPAPAISLTDIIRLAPEAGGAAWLSVQQDGNLNQRVFGGQLLAHACWLAMACEPQRHLSSLRLGFLQGALLDSPLHWTARTLQQGRRFSNFLLECQQSERMIASAQATTQVSVSGFTHAEPMPQVPPPQDLPTLADWEAHVLAQTGTPYTLQSRPWLELRLVDAQRFLLQPSDQPRLRYWLKVRERLPDDAATHSAALAYMSDFWLNYASLAPHQSLAGARQQLYVASLNHALWCYEPCRADEWLLFDVQSPRAGDGRGLAWGHVYNLAGQLVACAAQELACTLKGAGDSAPSGAQA